MKKMIGVFFSILLFSSQVVNAATVNISNVKETTQSAGGFESTTKKMDVEASLNTATEDALLLRRVYVFGSTDTKVALSDAGPKKFSPGFVIRSTNPNANGVVSKAQFLVRTKNKNLVLVKELNFGGTVSDSNTTVKPPYIQTNKDSNGNLVVNTNLPNSPLNVKDADGREFYNGSSNSSGKAVVPLSNSVGDTGFSWEFYDSPYEANAIRYRFNYDKYDDDYAMGTRVNGVFHPISGQTGRCGGNQPCKTNISPNAPSGGYYLRVQLKDDYGNVAHEFLFDSNGLIGDGAIYPLSLAVKDSGGNEYPYEIGTGNKITPPGEIIDDVASLPVEDGAGGETPGSCPCCDELKGMVGALDTAVQSQGYKLDELKGMSNQLASAVQNQGYKLDAMQGTLNSLESSMANVGSKLDTTNQKLDKIDNTLKDNFVPKQSHNINVPDWNSLYEQNKNQDLQKIQPVKDTNVYFSDPGQGTPVPTMPSQPQENYPVPIGESFDRQPSMNAQPSISRQQPGTSDIPLNRQPVGSPSASPQRDPVGSTTPMQRDPIGSKPNMNRDPVSSPSAPGQREPIGSPSSPGHRDPAGQRDPVGAKTPMNRDPVGQNPSMQRDPVKQRTNVMNKE